MRADLFEIRVDQILFTADQPMIREGVRATLCAYEGNAANLLNAARINLDNQNAREQYARRMASEKPDDELLGKAWDIRYNGFVKALWTVRETLIEALAPGAPQAEEPPPEPDAPLLQAGLALLDQPEVLAQAGETIRRLGYAGRDTTQPRLLVLALVSRSLERPINIVVTGPSSAGKSHLVGLVTKLFPVDATYLLAGMSERVLAYSQADLRHKYLIIGEASALHHDGMGASLLRNLAWEGSIRYEVTEKSPDGQQVTRLIEREGPTGFVTTTTGRVESELATRVLPVYIDDTPAGTRVILQDAARRAAGNTSEPPDVEPWWAAFWWLQERGDHDVVIPFAPALESKYPDKLVRTRRDFPQLLNLIRAAAILHQRQRSKDDCGRIVATIDDYRVVFRVAAPVYGALTSEGLTPVIRETVAAVVELIEAGSEYVTVAALAETLGIDREAVRKRVYRALNGGWIINAQEKDRGAMQLKAGAVLPTHSTGLPHPDELEQDMPDPPLGRAAGENAYQQPDVQHSDLPDSDDSAGQNGRTNAKIPPCPTVPPTDKSVGQLDNVGNRPMSNRFGDAGGQHRGSRTVGHESTGKRFASAATVQPRPRNDEVVAHIEWVEGDTKPCPSCKRHVWWRESGGGSEWECVACHPPRFE